MVVLLGVLFVSNFITCVCYQEKKSFLKEPSFSDKICSAEEVEFQLSARSAIVCAGHCIGEERCNSFVYQRDNGTCYGMEPAISCSMFTDLQGASFYRLHPLPITTDTHPLPTTTDTHPLPTTTDTQPLPTTTDTHPLPTTTDTTTTTITQPQTTSVLGCTSTSALLPTVEDSQITASSSYVNQERPHHARLDNDRSWSPKRTNKRDYIQVDFGSLRVVTAVILQGGTSGDPEWVKTYAFLTSNEACDYFEPPQETVFNEIFQGNKDTKTHSKSELIPAVAARCFRIYPYTFNEYPALRFELLGCLP